MTMDTKITEQEAIRREALEKLRELGIDPYPSETFEVNATAADIKEQYPKDNSLFQDIQLAGRVMGRRIMGSASFAELQDDRQDSALFQPR